MGKPDLAKADYDKALSLKPDDSFALITRSDMSLDADDLAHAAEDFNAALKAAPNDDALELEIASTYDSHRRWPEAIAHYDVWIAAHPRDEGLWAVLNNRCAARGKLGKELDKALDDCTLSIKKGPRNSDVLDSRGLIYLRLGRLK